ncbi:MAG TPA: response regulator [Myxococcota bacterium]|nr:response regulator [Myxococcota bacterium]
MSLSQEKLERLIARSADIVVATDREGKVAYYNDGASRILGYSPAEILGAYVGQLYPHLDEAKRVMRAMRASGHGGAGIVETFQTEFLSKAGERIPVAISGTILYDERGEEDGTIGFAKDLREILRKDQLATLGEVAIGLSHEINNPLAVIVNQLELLEREVVTLAGERDTSIECERLDAVRREVGRITGILERLGHMVESEDYATMEYIGPARMIDLRERRDLRRDPRLAGLRILVVDDDLGVCRSLEEILEAAGCNVETASDGADALARVEAGRFDLVLSDVVMPKMDGYELYTALRKLRPELPVLMMTAFHYDRDHVIKRSRLQGLEGVVFKKPVDPTRLCEVIAETVSRRAPERIGAR